MASPAEELDVDGTPVRLSSPDKVYFPALGDGGSKRTVVEYYRTVATNGALLRAVRDRPTHLQRFPDGVEGEEVYQKRIPARHPDHVETATVRFPSGRTADVLRPVRAADLVWAANLGTITFHPWTCRCPDVDRPDELRLDLDPQPGTDFADARDLALGVVKPLLDELGMVGFPKTSGGRGLHVYLRIAPQWEFLEVRRAGIALAREIVRRSDDRATTAWWKEERGQRIFLDYNQNNRDKTIAAAYSVRATPIATVSTPLTWDEIATAEPDEFTIATVPGLLAERGDPMEAMDEHVADIAPLFEMVERDAADGLGDLPYPPNHPKMPGEPKRVQPSRDADRPR
ncbi:ATP-dependent DNA ligase [Rhodococcus rhodnii]|uniref:DNA ligase (ATP) n=2 Tax=Rhodococcus rhodnii TaxID=38312 RepID=R7WJ77_9NOCA|nr:DNA polymerase domain-containing protein [Rhodococcus rhodnii]EOM75322.1 DNA ligase (ATP) [Rhodococcus rhodnii LMG 5362]TXG89973.1 ATP-dependent DNA ligase [Rhodococcus rhodnii]